MTGVYFKFKSMQYSLFTNFGVEIIGGVLFFITAIFIVRDKLKCENASAGESNYFPSLTMYSVGSSEYFEIDR